jgi:hypothetical protein
MSLTVKNCVSDSKIGSDGGVISGLNLPFFLCLDEDFKSYLQIMLQP